VFWKSAAAACLGTKSSFPSFERHRYEERKERRCRQCHRLTHQKHGESSIKDAAEQYNNNKGETKGDAVVARGSVTTPPPPPPPVEPG